ncbi:MAG: hypothetical protein HKN54_12190 [Flavobacteriaceae bacterium]|nr:hypothetical protein [Flavobacteriaceae bacterium]
MKNIKNLITCLMVLAYLGCTVDERGVSFINNVPAPSNLTVAFIVTQDNTGSVTMTPNGDGATSFKVFFGDGSGTSVDLSPGESAENTYEEGSYEVRVIATGINGLTTELIQPLVVSFQAPQNLVVNIENDGTLTKTVNLTATADFAITYEVDFGENVGAEPTMSNIGDTVSYTYEEAGIYTIVVTAMGAAIETTTYTEDFEVTAIVAPLVSAPVPPNRAEEDVISIFSAVYNDVPGSDYFPDWGQGGCCGSGWALFDLNGDEMLQYTNLSYQGNQFGSPQDVSQMEYIHLDVWTDDVLNTIEVSLISVSNGERPVVVPLNQNGWTSIDIPISDYTDQGGFTVADIHQLKYVGDPFAGGGSAFIDNVYFYKEPSGPTGLAGTWRMSPVAGSLGVGPSVGDTVWFNCDDTCVSERACYFDDLYVFEADGTFTNVLGADTFLEDWQGGGFSCGAPVAPHDGTAEATYVWDEGAGTVTINGTGAYIGLPKANNQGELPNVAVPSSITYNISFIDNNNIFVYIEAGAGVFWQFQLERETFASSPIAGIWQMAPEANSLGVGPAPGDTVWFSCDDTCVVERACYFNDYFVFFPDGTFANVLGSETFIEDWQGGGFNCGPAVAPHDGLTPATYSYDEGAGTVTIDGIGSYIGLPKANNQGELPNVAVPSSITYDVTFLDSNTISVIIESGAGVYWQYKLIKL